MKKKYFYYSTCCDCGARINKGSTRCRPCADEQLKTGVTKYYCKKCNVEIGYCSANYSNCLCRSCSKSIFIDKEILYQKYVTEKKSITQIAKETGYSYVTIYNKLKLHSILLRTRRESHLGKKRPEHSKLMSGEGNPMFNGWSSLEPYTSEFTNEFKESIRDRDNHKCQLCNKQENKLYRALDIHHINYNKQDCKETNLISLCNSCHCATNANRDYWFAFFTALLERSRLCGKFT